jgi:hypothetical protein
MPVKNTCGDVSFVRYTSYSTGFGQTVSLMYVNAETGSDKDVGFVRQGSSSREQHPDSASNDGLHLLEYEGLGDRRVVAASHPTITVSDEKVDQLGPEIFCVDKISLICQNTFRNVDLNKLILLKSVDKTNSLESRVIKNNKRT